MASAHAHKISVFLTKPLGLVLEDADGDDGGVVVESLLPGSIAEGVVQPRDFLIQVNGIPVASLDVEKVLAIIAGAAPKVSLMLSRAAPSSSSLSEAHFLVELPKPLGLELFDNDDIGVHVSELISGGAAEASGKISPGDLVLAVNGQDVSQLDVEAVLEAIGNAAGPVALTLRRGSAASGAEDDNGGEENAENDKEPLDIDQSHLIVNLEKPMGLELEELDDGGVRVYAMNDGEPAHASGYVHLGDLLLEIGGRNVSSLDVDAVIKLIGAAESPVSLLFARAGDAPAAKPKPKAPRIRST